MPEKNLQFVWPKDGPKGRSGHRGFFGRLNNVVTGRGPDIFLQRGGSRSPITPEIWGNWDSYHSYDAFIADMLDPVSRRQKRYDPNTRKYTTWSHPHDWFGHGADGLGPGSYPRFTFEEWGEMYKRLDRGRRINPRTMGSEWNHDGPKRFQQKHDWFWQNAHRLAENARENLNLDLWGPNENLRMHQQWPQDLNDWLVENGLGRGPRRQIYGWPKG